MSRSYRFWGGTVVFVAVAATLAGTPRGQGHWLRLDDSRKGTVWVVNRDRGELAVFDAGTGDVITTQLVGAGAHDICISEQARKAYITAETINTVTTVDTKTLANESIAVSPLPHHLEPSHDGRTVYVSLASHTRHGGAPQYAAIDTDDNSVTYTTTSHNPAARSHGPHPSLDGETVYVAHDLGDEVSAHRHRDRQHRLQHHANPEGGRSDRHPVRARALGVVARRRNGEAHRSRHQHHHRLDSRRRSTRVRDAHAVRADAGGQPAGKPGDARLRRHVPPHTYRHCADCRRGYVRRPGSDDQRRALRLRHVRRAA